MLRQLAAETLVTFFKGKIILAAHHLPIPSLDRSDWSIIFSTVGKVESNASNAGSYRVKQLFSLTTGIFCHNGES